MTILLRFKLSYSLILIKESISAYRTDTKENVDVKADLVIGADGAFSAVRKAMMKQPLFDFNQKYIEHGYLELCIPADENGGVSCFNSYNFWGHSNTKSDIIRKATYYQISTFQYYIVEISVIVSHTFILYIRNHTNSNIKHIKDNIDPVTRIKK